MKHGGITYYKDKLVIRQKFKDGSLAFQGLRVGKNCPLESKYRKIYAKNGIIATIKALMQDKKLSLSEAKSLIDNSK